MAKKQKRSVSSSLQTQTAGMSERAAQARASFTQDFKPDYSAVISDLKKIAILAASGISVLVVLTFILR